MSLLHCLAESLKDAFCSHRVPQSPFDYATPAAKLPSHPQNIKLTAVSVMPLRLKRTKKEERITTDKIYNEQKMITSCKVNPKYRVKPNIGKELMEMSGITADVRRDLGTLSEKERETKAQDISFLCHMKKILSFALHMTRCQI